MLHDRLGAELEPGGTLLVVDVEGFNTNPEGHFYSADPLGYYVSCDPILGGVLGVLSVPRPSWRRSRRSAAARRATAAPICGPSAPPCSPCLPVVTSTNQSMRPARCAYRTMAATVGASSFSLIPRR